MANKEEWKKEWQDMPEFEMEDLSSFRKIIEHYATKKLDNDNVIDFEHYKMWIKGKK